MTILVVDDSPIDRRLASGLLEKAGYKTRTAENGHAALASLEAARAELVVTDMSMPEMDGLELVEKVRSKYADIPVILMTSLGVEDLAVRALQRGAASFVPKRDLARSLAETVRSILEISAGEDAPPSSRTLSLRRWELGNDLAEVNAVVGILETRLAHLQLDDTARIQVSVALREAIVNAMLHGNLELESSLKETDPEKHDALREERRKLSPYRERRVTITVTETADQITYVVSDSGPGFDTSNLPDPLDLSNLERASGRGLFLIRTFMDDVSHTDGGRTISMVKRKTPATPAP